MPFWMRWSTIVDSCVNCAVWPLFECHPFSGHQHRVWSILTVLLTYQNKNRSCQAKSTFKLSGFDMLFTRVEKQSTGKPTFPACVLYSVLFKLIFVKRFDWKYLQYSPYKFSCSFAELLLNICHRNTVSQQTNSSRTTSYITLYSNSIFCNQ